MDTVLNNIISRKMSLKYCGNNDAGRRVLQTTITSLILVHMQGYRDLFSKLCPLRICKKKKIDFFQKFTLEYLLNHAKAHNGRVNIFISNWSKQVQLTNV